MIWDFWGKEKEHWIRRQNHSSLYPIFSHQANPHPLSPNGLICKKLNLVKMRMDTSMQDVQNVKQNLMV